MTTDALSKLPAPTWRGIPFPLSSLENGFTHDHVEHKFILRDGMLVEATGRNGLNFNAQIPFNNGVQAASFEPWSGQVLYPDIFRKFLNAVLDKSSGEFIHPDFGPIQCKARDVSWRYGASLRDGVELSCRFYQSTDNPDEINAALSAQAPMATAMASATKLDQEIAAAGPLPELDNDKQSFSSMMQSYNDGTGNIGRINSKLENTSAALNRLNHVQYWPLRSATEDMRWSMFNLGTFSGNSTQPVRQHTVLSGTSLSSIAIRLNVRIDDLARLNPGLARDPYVPPGTRVRYLPFGA